MMWRRELDTSDLSAPDGNVAGVELTTSSGGKPGYK
jgi:hypothetical protein